MQCVLQRLWKLDKYRPKQEVPSLKDYQADDPYLKVKLIHLLYTKASTTVGQWKSGRQQAILKEWRPEEKSDTCQMTQIWDLKICVKRSYAVISRFRQSWGSAMAWDCILLHLVRMDVIRSTGSTVELDPPFITTWKTSFFPLFLHLISIHFSARKWKHIANTPKAYLDRRTYSGTLSVTVWLCSVFAIHPVFPLGFGHISINHCTHSPFSKQNIKERVVIKTLLRIVFTGYQASDFGYSYCVKIINFVSSGVSIPHTWHNSYISWKIQCFQASTKDQWIMAVSSIHPLGTKNLWRNGHGSK